MKRHERIFNAAVDIAVNDKFKNITRDRVAELADVSTGAVNYHYETVTNLKHQVMKHAVEHQLLGVIAEGLVDGHPIANLATKQLKQKALKQFWK